MADQGRGCARERETLGADTLPFSWEPGSGPGVCRFSRWLFLKELWQCEQCSPGLLEGRCIPSSPDLQWHEEI